MAVVSKDKAMNGDMPDFDFNKIFGLSVTHDQKDVDYSLDKPEGMTDRQEQPLTSRELSSMPFICLNNSGRRN